MKIIELEPIPRDRTLFKLASFKLIPKEMGCYVLATFENDILYIGLSDNLFIRFQQHLSNIEKTKPTEQGKVIWFYYLVLRSNNLPKFERTWLNQYINVHGKFPILNKANSPIS